MGIKSGLPDRALTRRSIWTGLLLVAGIAWFAPFNDRLSNTPFIGNHYPIGVVMLLAILVLVVNPLLIFSRRNPYSAGELIVVFTMMLVSCAAPMSGLMRYWEPLVIQPIARLEALPSLSDLIPAWAVPTKDPASPIVRNFYLGIDASRGEHIPVLAFVRPALIWGVLIAAVLGAVMFLAAIFRRQWVYHERLSYPLSIITLDLLAQPQPGDYFNKTWRNSLLWAGAGIPIFLYTLNGLHQIFPAVPWVSLGFNFSNAFTEHPWDALPRYITVNRVYFSAIGLAFFIPSEVAFSLCFFLVANGLARVFFENVGIDAGPMEPVRGMGIYLAYFISILWLARRHLGYVFKSAIQNAPRAADEFATYRSMLVGFVVCSIVAWLWMIAVGVQPVVALVVLGLGMMLFTLLSRVQAETGLFFLGIPWSPPDFLSLMLGPKLVNAGSYLWSGMISRLFFSDVREALMPYTTTALRMGNDIKPERRRGLLAWLIVAVGLSVVLSGLVHHYQSYALGRIDYDEHATQSMPNNLMNDTYDFAISPQSSGEGAVWRHFTLGAALVGVMMMGRALFTFWPFHPVGLLLMNSWPLQVFWVSILVGWAMKATLMRYGGAILFSRARAFFIGLVVGEILSGGMWMFIGVIFRNVHFELLPA